MRENAFNVYTVVYSIPQKKHIKQLQEKKKYQYETEMIKQPTADVWMLM